MHNKMHGFTLIELLIVVSIIAILAAVSISVYQDLGIRARVSEGLGMVSPAKVAVSEAIYAADGLPADQAATGYVTPPATNNVSSITIGANGIIIVTFTASAGNGTIIFQPTLVGNNNVTWDCTGGTLLDRYRPSICR